MNEWAVSLHDVAPCTWARCERLLALCDEYAAPVTLLVVPDHHHRGRADRDAAFVDALRARVARGDEVVAHGCFHVDTAPPPRALRDWVARRVLTDREGEFAALDADAAARRLAESRALLAALDLPLAGFVPPAWLLGDGARRALGASAYAYTSTRDTLYALPDWQPVHAPSLVYSTRTRWRRAASRLWNHARLRALADAPRVRVALHPADATHAAVLADWRSLLTALAAARRVRLESAWLPLRDSSADRPWARSASAVPAAPAPAL